MEKLLLYFRNSGLLEKVLNGGEKIMKKEKKKEKEKGKKSPPL